MKYRHNITGQIFNDEEELRKAYPNTSFPMLFDKYALEYANVQEVINAPPPTVDNTKRVEYAGITLIDDKWTDTWAILPLHDDPEQQMNWEKDCFEGQWDNIRNERDRILRDTDYIILSDSQATEECKREFIAYRKALRDITSTQTDPYNISWPLAPTYVKQL